ncbi:hypothetical protein LTR95_006220 [Oleoguttula sp. CCFEE 5521]
MAMKSVAVFSATVVSVLGQSGLSTVTVSGNSTWSNSLSLTASTSFTTTSLTSSPDTSASSIISASSASSPDMPAASYSTTSIAIVASAAGRKFTSSVLSTVPSTSETVVSSLIDVSATDSALPSPNKTAIGHSATTIEMPAASDNPRISGFAVASRNTSVSYAAETILAGSTYLLYTTSNSTSMTTTAVSAGRLISLNTTATSTNTTMTTGFAGLITSANQNITAPSKGTGFTYGSGNDSANFPPPTTSVASNSTFANSTAPNNSTSVAMNTSSFDYASQCNSLTASWESASFSWLRYHAVSYIVTNSRYEVETVYGTISAPTTVTSCLGASRVLGGQVLSVTSESESTTNQTWMIMTSSEATLFPTPKPVCTIGTTDCSSLWNEYDSSMNALTTTYNAAVTMLPTPPSCQDPRTDAYCQTCTVQANEVQMYYWPLIAVGNECDPDRQFLTPTPTIVGQPNTAELDGYTFTSPSVYLSFDWIYALSHTKFCGPTEMRSTIIAIPPEDVSTVRFSYVQYGPSVETFVWSATTFTETDPRLDLGTYTLSGGSKVVTVDGRRDLTASAAFPVSFQDFMGAVPVDAWSSEASVANWGGSIIIDAQYSPNIAVPSMLRSLYPAWANCELYREPGASGGAKPDTIGDASTVRPSTGIVAVSIIVEVASIQVTGQTSPDVGGGERITTTSQIAKDPVSTTARGTIPAEESQSLQDPSNPNNGVSIIRQSALPISTVAIIGGTSVIVVSSGTVVVVGSQTVTSGAPAVTINGQEVSQGSSGLLVGTTSTLLPIPALSPVVPPATVVVGGTTVIAAAQGSFVVVGGQTLIQAGGAATVAGQVISFGSSGLVVGGTSTILTVPSPPPSAASRAVVIAGSSVAAVIKGTIAGIGGQTLTLGGSPVTIAGQKVTLASNGLLAVGSSTLLPATSKITEVAQSGQIINIDGTDVSIVPVNGGVLISDGVTTVTVKSGSTATIQGHTIELDKGSNSITIDDTKIVTLDAANQAAGNLVLIGGTTIFVSRADGAVQLTSGGKTIIVNPSETAIFAGHLVSAAADGQSVTFDATRTVSVDAALGAAPTVAKVILLDDSPVAITRTASELTLSDGSRSVQVAFGQTVQFNGHTIAASADGRSVVIDGTRAIALYSLPAQPALPGTVFMLGDTSVVIVRVGDSIVVSDGSTAILLIAGTTITYNGHTVTLAHDAQSLTVDGTLIVSLSAVAKTQSAMTASDGHVWSAVQYGDTVVLTDGATSMILRPGQQVPLGEPIATNSTQRVAYTTLATLPSGPNAALITAPASLGGAIFTASSGAIGVILLIDGTHTVTIQPGQIATLDDVTVSAASDGSYVVVDGTRTVYLTSGPSMTGNGPSHNSALATPDASATDGGRQTIASNPAGSSASRTLHTSLGALIRVLCIMVVILCLQETT